MRPTAVVQVEFESPAESVFDAWLRNGPEITSRFGVVLFLGPTARDPTAQSEGLGRSLPI
jgi:hypothetical protein